MAAKRLLCIAGDLPELRQTKLGGPSGNQTDFTYGSHGGVLSEMQPAPAAGAARPLKLYTYVQKYAYIKNSGGSLVQAATPIWVLNTETLCQTAPTTLKSSTR